MLIGPPSLTLVSTFFWILPMAARSERLIVIITKKHLIDRHYERSLLPRNCSWIKLVLYKKKTIKQLLIARSASPLKSTQKHSLKPAFWAHVNETLHINPSFYQNHWSPQSGKLFVGSQWSGMLSKFSKCEYLTILSSPVWATWNWVVGIHFTQLTCQSDNYLIFHHHHNLY